MGKQKQSWKNFVALWSKFGIEPQEASEILVRIGYIKIMIHLTGIFGKTKKIENIS